MGVVDQARYFVVGRAQQLHSAWHLNVHQRKYSVLLANTQVVGNGDCCKGILHVEEAGHGQRSGAGPGWRMHGKRDHALVRGDFVRPNGGVGIGCGEGQDLLASLRTLHDLVKHHGVLVDDGHASEVKNLQFALKVIFKSRVFNRGNVIGSNV